MIANHEKIQSEMTTFVRVNTWYGLSLYLADISMYVAMIYGVLFLPELWMKIVASIGAGMKISNLTTIAHDAAHNSLTKSRSLNKFIAVTSLLVGLFNYRLWAYNHHQLHHHMTNRDFPDSIPPDAYTPYSKEEFDALSTFDQWKERFYRTPTLLGFGAYFMFERWIKVFIYPRSHMPKEIMTSSWRHFVLVTFYFSGFIGLLLCAPMYSNTSSTVAILFGLVVPFYISRCFMGFTLYIQHTNERVAWFKEALKENDSQNLNRKQEFVSVQVIVPKWVSLLAHHVYDHGAHHVCPAIPCYRLGPAQTRLNELLGKRALSEQFSLTWLFKTMKKCKLYDYHNHRWLDFDGNPTTESTLVYDVVKYADAA